MTTINAAPSDRRYPIGRFSYDGPYSPEQRKPLIQSIAEAPQKMHAAVYGLSAEQMDTPYREGGWTIRQVVHHVPDSHMNAFLRFKWALTEDHPTIKPYAEDKWALLSDTQDTPTEVSLNLLDALHQRWVVLLNGIRASDWKRELTHPQAGEMSLDKVLGLYSWHGRHHVAHITSLKERKGWK